MESRTLLRDLPVGAFDELVADLGQPGYRAVQLRAWLFEHGALAWDEMTNLPQSLRDRFAESYDLCGLAPTERQCSQDGTRKFLFELRDGETVESVVIPMESHATFCVSSQVGCAMACSFCATARGGLVRQLSPGEILEQVLHLARDLVADPLPGDPARAFNVVFMGMGEPLDNTAGVFQAVRTMTDPAGMGMSSRRITISTSGHAEGLRALASLETPVGLTLSVNSCEAETRKRLMPVPGRTPLEESLELSAQHSQRIHRPVTVAYVLIADVNDGDGEAAALAALVRGRPFKINLIPMNRIDDRFGPPTADRLLGFQATLASLGVRSTIRISGGEDIDAACGQLRRKRRV